VLAEEALPVAAYVEPLVLAARTTGIAELGELPDEVRVQPRTDLGAERLVLGREAQVHSVTVTWGYRNLTRCQKRCRPTVSSSRT
jgi:hypothetical protein